MYDTDTTTSPPDSPLPDTRPWPRRHPWLAGLISLAIFIVAMSVLGSLGSHKTASTAAAPRTSTSAPVQAVTATDPNGLACAQLDPAGYCPGDDPAAAVTTQAPQAPAAPAITTSQQQALTSAQGYLSDGQGFSRTGLIGQLTSAYGEGFNQADATWAVDHSGANWNDQAVISAKGYMSDGQGFSRGGLIDQLTSAYGEQFTYAQATYAAGQVGL
jgi:hypothetical protein